MTVAQIEHAPTFSDPLPAADTFDRMEALARRRRSEITFALITKVDLDEFTPRLSESPAETEARRDQLVNRLTHAELRRAEVEMEIVEVARLIVAEHSNFDFPGEQQAPGTGAGFWGDGSTLPGARLKDPTEERAPGFLQILRD